MTKFKLTKKEKLEDLLLTQLAMLEKRFEHIRDLSEESRNEAVIAFTEIRKYKTEIEGRFK